MDVLSYLRKAWDVAAVWFGRRFAFFQGVFARKRQKRRKDVQDDKVQEIPNDGESTPLADAGMQPAMNDTERRQKGEKKAANEKDATAAASLDMNQLLKKKRERE